MIRFCASDLHIGYEHSNHDKILSFLDIVEKEANMLILCGDTFDLWRTPYDSILDHIKPQFEQVMTRIKQVGRKIPIIIIPGNHDYNLKKLWKNYQYYYVPIRDPFTINSINNHFCHGWEFDLRMRLSSFAFTWIIELFPSIYQRYYKKPSQIFSSSDEPDNLCIKIHNEANQYAIKNNLDYVIMGHTHIPMIWNHVIDCGDFVDSCSYIKLDKNIPELKFI